VRLSNALLNAATGVSVVCALLVTIARLHVSSTTPGSRLAPTTVADWRGYAREGNRMGPATAPVTIVEWADFQCPFCKKAEAGLHAIRRRYGVSIVYRHMPFHEFSFAAAVASECAARDGKFESLHDAFFEQADSIGHKSWTRFALDAGLTDTARFARCLGDTVVMRRVLRDTVAAASLALSGTPSFLIAGTLISGYRGEEALDSVVRAKMR